MHWAPNSSPTSVKRLPAMSFATRRAASGRSSTPYIPRIDRHPSVVSSCSGLVHSTFGSMATIPASSTSMITTRRGTPICGAAMPMPWATTIDANILATSDSISRRERRGFLAGPCRTGSPIFRTSTTFDRLDRLRLRRQEHEPSEGWISETPAPGQLGLREGEVVVRRGGEYRVVLGEVRLKNAAAAGSTSARSSQDLREQLKGTLGRGEVRQVEHRVGVDDTDEGHPRQVEALRQHLRANDHLRITRAHPLVGGRMRALRAHGVAVQSDDLRPRHRGSHLFLHALRSDAQLSDSRTAADRAPFRGARLTPSAAMTDQ